MKLSHMSALACASVVLVSGGVFADQPATSPVGHWKTFDRKTAKANSIVHLWETNGELRGRIEKLINPPTKDPVCEKCPGDKRNKPLVGLEFLWGFKRERSGWSEGKVLDPEDGKIYDASIELIDGGKRLKVFGYTRIVVKIGETEIWERVVPPK